MHTATYSPEDDKLRLYPECRLPQDEYQRLRDAGFKWAPKQELFVAYWSPLRERILIELADEITDEDTSLVDRAEAKAERLSNIADRNLREANAAAAAVKERADGIPLGQPILIGHHSEKHARRDAEKIERGMRRAVDCWKSSKYWTARAADAISHAKHIQSSQVRARRIKTLEADLRKHQRDLAENALSINTWERATNESDIRIAVGRSYITHSFTVAEYPRTDGQSTYEGPMDLEYAIKDEICTLEHARELALNCLRKSTPHYEAWIEHLENRLTYERAMLNEQGGTVADRTKPEVGGACRCWASPLYGAGWSYIRKVNRVSVTIESAWQYSDKPHTLTMPFDKLKAIMSRSQVEAARDAGQIAEVPMGYGFKLLTEPVTPPRYEQEPEPSEFSALEDSLNAGVKTVTAPCLFPTPPDIAARMVQLAGIAPGHRVLEPSAGTGRLLQALPDGTEAVAVEVNYQLASALNARCSDFLECSPDDLGGFDRIIMNPPFDHGLDIKHIAHAMQFLKPGGKLVALCAAGPCQERTLQPLSEHWETLPPGSFANAGTNVNVAMMLISN